MIRLSTILSYTTIFFVGGFCFTACDEGKIYPPENNGLSGNKINMEIVFTGQEAWPAEYMLVFAAFGDDEEMPVVSKIISKPASENEKVIYTLNGLDERSKKVTISVVNKGRQALYHFYSYPIDSDVEEMTLPVETIDLAAFDRIQKQVFNNYCITCHGAGDHAAANLNLTEGKSRAQLVNMEAELSSDNKKLVYPEKSEQSFLMDILENDLIHYNHTDVLPEKELITLIKTWIDSGAKE